MRRTKSPKVVWLPPNQELDQLSTVFTNGSALFGLGLAVSGAQPVDVAEIGLTIDTPRDPATESLSDLENSGYRVRRIVGHIWLFGDRIDEESGIERVLIEAGIIVRRVDQAGVPLVKAVDAAAGTFDNQSATAAVNAGDPWVWMKSWFLSVPEFTLDTTTAGKNCTELLVDVAYHLDQKTARVVGPEERLFLSVSAVAFGGAAQSELTNLTSVFAHIRVLGSMRTTSGNRRNASR